MWLTYGYRKLIKIGSIMTIVNMILFGAPFIGLFPNQNIFPQIQTALLGLRLVVSRLMIDKHTVAAADSTMLHRYERAFGISGRLEILCTSFLASFFSVILDSIAVWSTLAIGISEFLSFERMFAVWKVVVLNDICAFMLIAVLLDILSVRCDSILQASSWCKKLVYGIDGYGALFSGLAYRLSMTPRIFEWLAFVSWGYWSTGQIALIVLANNQFGSCDDTFGITCNGNFFLESLKFSQWRVSHGSDMIVLAICLGTVARMVVM